MKEHANNLAEALRFLVISYMDSGVVSRTEMENILEDTLQYIQRRNLEPESLQREYR
jgi:hypothetical protein